MATFNGVSLGFVFSMTPAAAPIARQVAAYCGANGLQVTNHGTRGGSTIVEGAILALAPTFLASAEGSLRALQLNGGAYVLVDTLGTAWPGVILASFRPKGRVMNIATGGYARRYDAEFLHIL